MEKFFALIRYAIREEEDVPQIAPEEWMDIYLMAEQQALLGVAFVGIEKIKNSHEELTIPRDFLLKWIFTAEQIKLRNKLLNQRCVELVEQLQKDGFGCCILKGQGNATMYPNPYTRTPGDIDVWVKPDVESEVGYEKSRIIKYAKAQLPDAEVRVYHVEYEWKGIPAELHFMPGIMNNPWYNGRLQKWYLSHAEHTENVELSDGAGRIPVPTVAFNTVYQLAHLMHHFFDEGIGLRQFVDYYFLLKAENVKIEKLKISSSTLKRLGLWKFAGAVMYVMREVFHLEAQYMIAPVDERRGRTLMDEILKGGNFGRYSGLTEHSVGRKYWLKNWRSLHFVREYPAEALSEPLFRTWHFFWRMRH